MPSNFLRRIFHIDAVDILIASIAGLAFLIFAAYFTYFYFAKDLGTKDAIMNVKDTGVVLLDRNDKPFFSFYEGKVEQFVPLEKVPNTTQKAIIAIEDKDFYTHPGFSVTSIIRSLWADVNQQKLAYGGSTITQQLVKNALLTHRKDFLRKYQEIILAKEIERRYSKNEILEMYLNSVYFGRGAIGIEQAAHIYFAKKATDLDPAESAYLAALLPAPTRLSNVDDDAKARQEIVLQKMYEQKYITAQEFEKAKNEKLAFTKREDNINSIAPHFALMVRDELIAKYGEDAVTRSGYKVKTTLDIEKQQYAEQAVKDGVARLAPHRVTNGGAIVLNPKTGEILALVGSHDWNDDKNGKLNIMLAQRQPGSSFKPIVYSKAIENGTITAATILHDEPITYKTQTGDYKPLDYDGKFRGNVTVRRALVNSLNIPAVEVMSKVGVDQALSQAHKLGINTLNDPSRFGLALVLGAGEVKPIELAEAYSVFANKGDRLTPTAILEIKDKQDRRIYKYSPSPESVIPSGVAYIISSILSDNATRAEVFGSALNISRPAAAKTGTTQNYKDAWTMGYTPSLVVGVWVGNNDGTPMDNVAGALGPAPIWRQLMEHYLAGTPVENFEKPSDVDAIRACRSGGIADPSDTSAYTEYFLKGTAPTGHCTPPTPSPDPNATPQPTDNNQASPPPSPSQDNPGGGPEEQKKSEENTIEITVPAQ